MSKVCQAALLAVTGLLVAPPTSAAADTPPAVRSSVPLPGGAAALSDALGSPRALDRAFILLEAARLVHENPPGESQETDVRRRQLAEYLKKRREAKRSDQPADETIPLPLTPAVWSDVVFDRRLRDAEIAFAILEDRQASFLYRGLSALDEETLRFLAADRKTLGAIYKLHAAVFGAFGRSLRVANGEVQVPGGPDARPLWEALAKQPVTEPALFMLAVLSADAGRLAFFFDTMAHLDEPARRYALGLDRPAGFRLVGISALYQVVATRSPSWQVTRRPYSRAALDVSLLFRQLRFTGDGRLAGPMWPVLLARALEDLPGVLAGMGGGTWLPQDPARDVAALVPTHQVDAAWLADRVLAGWPQIGRQRLDAIAFGQRVFPHPDPNTAADMLVAIRGRIVFPTLMVALERMGANDPSLYALAVRHAARLMAMTSAGAAATALAQFQASVAILERAARERTLMPEGAQALASSLFQLEPDAERGYGDAVRRWLDEKLLPELWQATGESMASSSAETAVLKGLAGDVPRPKEAPPTVEWEGRAYHVNRGAAEFARLRALREIQGGANLDRALGFARAVADALTVGSAGESVIRDVVLADTLTSIVYAIHLGGPDGPALTGGNVALRHDFGLLQTRTAPWQVPPGWAEPIEDASGGWHVTGSLIGLDVGLSRFALRWLSADALPPMPLLNANERRTFAESVALANLLEFADADRDRLVRAIDRGRLRVASLVTSPGAIDQVAADAHLSEWRREAMRWMLANDRVLVPRSFSLVEELWLGGADPPPDAWGMSAVATSGCFCSAFPAPDAWEEFAGRPAEGLLATRLPDLTLRAARELHARNLPAALVPGILGVAMNDLLHEAQPVHHDDWLSVVRYVHDLPSERFVDYISSLTAAGPLVPARERPDAEAASELGGVQAPPPTER